MNTQQSQLTYGKEFLLALMSARKEMNSPEKSGRNAHLKYDYAKYDDFVKAYEPALNKNGLEIVHEAFQIDLAHELLVTRLVHMETRQYSTVQSIINRHPNDQDYGKCISYAKKYAYQTIVGSPCGDDSDADDNRISEEQFKALKSELSNCSASVEQALLQRGNITTLRELYSADFEKVMEWIKKQKQCAPAHQAAK